MTSVVARALPARVEVLAAIAIAWVLVLASQLTDAPAALRHDALAEGGLPPLAALGLFLVAWQAMVAAMMLPSALPLIGLFDRVSARQPGATPLRWTFLFGYGVVWAVFGALGLGLDGVVHKAVEAFAPLAERPWLVASAVLAGAGLFQFTDLKRQCLRECRNPAQYMVSHYRRGIAGAFRLGAGHGLFCLGCCWALMLVMFAAGVANLVWMATLTLVTLFERTGRDGERGVVPIGIGLLALSLLVAANPPWLPALW